MKWSKFNHSLLSFFIAIKCTKTCTLLPVAQYWMLRFFFIYIMTEMCFPLRQNTCACSLFFLPVGKDHPSWFFCFSVRCSFDEQPTTWHLVPPVFWQESFYKWFGQEKKMHHRTVWCHRTMTQQSRVRKTKKVMRPFEVVDRQYLRTLVIHQWRWHFHCISVKWLHLIVAELVFPLHDYIKGFGVALHCVLRFSLCSLGIEEA